MAAQFFLKNIHPEMRNAASNLFGKPKVLHSRPNVFGELMRVLISPSEDVEQAVNWVLGGVDPDISLHMRMLMNRYCNEPFTLFPDWVKFYIQKFKVGEVGRLSGLLFLSLVTSIKRMDVMGMDVLS